MMGVWSQTDVCIRYSGCEELYHDRSSPMQVLKMIASAAYISLIS